MQRCTKTSIAAAKEKLAVEFDGWKYKRFKFIWSGSENIEAGWTLWAGNETFYTVAFPFVGKCDVSADKGIKDWYWKISVLKKKHCKILTFFLILLNLVAMPKKKFNKIPGIPK